MDIGRKLLSVSALALAALVAVACSDAADPITSALGDQEASLDHRPGESSTGTVTYFAELSALNGSGVSGKARLLDKGNGTFQVTVTARGLAAGQVHAQHIHGFLEPVAQSECPTLATDDVDDSGLVEVGEGVDGVGRDYGGILVPLDGSLDVAEGLGELATFPVASGGGSIQYDEAIDKDDLALNGGGAFGDLALGAHAVVLHGAFVDGEYVATLPVACGLIDQRNSR